MTLLGRKPRDEQGAYAVLFAILGVFLIGMAALAVDLGNAMARKTDSQGQADFAALAAGGELPGTVPTSGDLATLANSDTDWMAVVNQARDYLNNNTPQNDTCTGTECVTSADLIDQEPDNGEILFAHEYAAMQDDEPNRCAANGLCVISPKDTVDYGLARIFGDGFESRDIQADATVQIYSPDLGPMPVYAVDGCDYGRQTITDPATGHTTSGPTNLANSGDTNAANLTAITAPTPPQIDVVNPAGPSNTVLSVSGTSFTKTNGNAQGQYRVTKMGFFLDNGTAPVEVAVEAATRTETFVRITTIPQAVASNEGLYYVRLYVEGTNSPTTVTPKWSAMDDALPFRVGEPVLECDAASNDGNFGTLLLERSDVSSVNDQLAMNMADKLQDPLSLAVHTWAITNGTGTCTDGQDGAKESGLPNPGLRSGTNCVDTDTGLPANAATMGLVTGVAGREGRLARADTTPGCSPDDDSDNRTLNIQHTNYSINDDILSCFLTDGTTSLDDISRADYSGGAVLDETIYESPRFIVVPVLKVDPSSGGSNRYSIIDFRPGFITDEVVAASTVRGTHTATSDNGVMQDGNDIKQVKVVFFNINALPPKLDGPITDYLGTGPKILRLID